MTLQELIDKGKHSYKKEEGIILFKELLKNKKTLYKGVLHKSDGKESKRCINWKSYPSDDSKRKFIDIFAEYLNVNEIFDFEEIVDYTNYNGRESRKELHDREIELFKNYKNYWVTPSKGKNGKLKRMDEDKMCHCFFHAKKISDFVCEDYQIPLVDGGANNIDFMMSKGNVLYICEVKKFEAPETLLRCVLEISTYFQQLNIEKFQKVYSGFEKIQTTILVPIDSEAYKEYKEISNYPNLQELMHKLDVIVYGLDYNIETNQFVIKE